MRPERIQKVAGGVLVAFVVVVALKIRACRTRLRCLSRLQRPAGGESESDLSLWSAIDTFLAVLVYGVAAALVVFIGKIAQITVTTPVPEQKNETAAEGREDRFCGPGASFEVPEPSPLPDVRE